VIRGIAPFDIKSWSVVGKYIIQNLPVSTSPYVKSLCPSYESEVAWSPNKPYIMYGGSNSYNVEREGYLTAPANSDITNWKWTYHAYPKQAEIVIGLLMFMICFGQEIPLFY
jgi:hypothetical protein